ncbi:hypothetical protein AGMMS50233_06480 [Endomicrobiia bacterium]|nr:hypothetical protein AGMMS50233_06480 [Endomicrobiia bacterium]
MKNKFLLILAAAAAFAALSCTPALEVTAPDLGNFNDSKSAVYGTGSVTWADFFTIDTPIPLDTAAGDSSGANKTVKITLNTPASGYYLDLLRKTGADFEAGVKEGFQFISFTSAGTSAASVAGEAAITVESVTRNGNDAYVKLALPTTISGNIQIRALADKLTYNNGNKVDGDGNKIPGEEFYDDYYYPLISVANAANAYPSVSKQKYSVSFGTPTPDAVDYTARTVKVRLTYSAYSNDASDYTSTLGGLYKVQKYDRTSRQWADYAGVTAWARESGNPDQFAATVSGLANTDAFRIVEINPSGFETAVDLFGHKQRLIGVGSSFTTRNKVYVASTFPGVVNGIGGENYVQNTGNPFTLLSADPTLPGNRGVVLKFSFPAVTVGNLGLNDINLANFKKGFKIGTDGSGSSFIPIIDAKLVYDPFYATGFASGVPTRLDVYLDPAYVKVSQTRYLFLSPAYGYKGDNAAVNLVKPGVFGDYNNYDQVIYDNGEYQTDWVGSFSLGPQF